MSTDMDETLEIDVKTVDDLELDPLAAYATLRGYTPNAPMFLLESLSHDGQDRAEAGRYSIIGYRIRRSEMTPPGVDAIAVQHKKYSERPPQESFAQALAEACVGYFSSSVASSWHKIQLCKDEGPTSYVVAGSAVAVFDHLEGTITTAGPKAGNMAERCLWEMTHGPELDLLEEVDENGRPSKIGSELNDEQLQARVARAKAYLHEVDAVMLAHTITAAVGDADVFDTYCALRRIGKAAHGYFIDYGALPGQSHTRICGVSDHTAYLRRRGQDGPDPAEALREVLPHTATVGSPARAAAKLIRQVEDSSRQQWGGVVGYMCPGDECGLVLADNLIIAQGEFYWCTTGVTTVAETEPSDAPTLALESAKARLAAIAAAEKKGAKA